jgi:chromosome segregation ATPase
MTTTQTTLVELRTRMADLWKEANAAGYRNPAELLPEEMQANSHIVDELKGAKEYIKDVEAREVDLQSQVKDLKTQLEAEKEKVVAIPEDHKELLIEVELLKDRVEFYKGLQTDAERHQQLYINKWQAAIQSNTESSELHLKIAALQLENSQQRQAIVQLAEHDRQAHEVFQEAQMQDQALLAKKDTHIEFLQNSFNQVEERYNTLEDEKIDFEAAYEDLLARTEQQNEELVNRLNVMTQHAERLQRINNAAVCEAKTIRYFFHDCTLILSTIQQILSQVFSADEKSSETIVYNPDELHRLVSAARSQCDAFAIIRRVMQEQGLEVEEVRMELDGMWCSATKTHECLTKMEGDLEGFLEGLKMKPGLLGKMKGKFIRRSKK